MAVKVGPGGIEVVAPDTVAVAFEAAPVRRASRSIARIRGPVPLATPGSARLDAALLDALAKQDLPLVQTVQLSAETGASGRRSLPQAASARLTVPVGPEEDAVVLLQQAEVYSWSLPVERSPAAPGTRRTAGQGAQVVFDLPLGAATPGPADRRMLGSALLAPIRAFVFRFAGRRLVGEAVRFQERNIRPGLVRIAGHDPRSWVSGPPIVPAAPKAGTRHRVLLLVHGTFSSTAGGFGQLGPTAWGSAFLDACLAGYDLVLGYDHRTLSETPVENAAALLAALRGLDWGKAGAPEIDIVAHSRGGLVARWLVESLTPASGWDAVYRRAILVGATNGGTELARPENWAAFLDLYTNLAVAACRAFAFLPQAGIAAAILSETIATLGEFVKQIALSGLDAAIAPGLFAMTPGNPSLTELNGLQPSQPAAADAIYHVVSSAFAPTLFGTEHQPAEFPLRLAQVLAGSTVTGLMRGAENDIVVDTPSMSAIDVGLGTFVRDTLHFAASPLIYHTNYFSRPEVVNALTRWLDLRAAPSAPARTTRGGGRAPALLESLVDPRPASGGLPASVDTDILVADPARPARDVLAEMAARAPSFIVFESHAPDGGRLSHVFDPSELTTALGKAVGPVSEALAFHTRAGDAVVPVDQVARATRRGQSVFPIDFATSRDRPSRLVVASTVGPVGVVPNAAEIVLDADIGSLMERITASTDRILTRRTMPTFAGPQAFTAAVQGGAKPAGVDPRRVRRGAPVAADAALEPAPPPALETEATCHVLAESAPTVKSGRDLTVRVAISREAIAATLPMNAQGVAKVDPERPILVNVWPKRGFTFAEDDDPAELRLPPAGEVADAYFRLRATDVGKGELWVVARQGKLPLVTLKLNPEVVEGELPSGGAGELVAQASVPLARGPMPTHTLTIIELEQSQSGTTFRFEFNSPTLGELQVYKQKIPGDRNAYVDGLYKDIEGAWTGSRRQVVNFNKRLRDIGARLFDRLLPEKLRADLWRYRDSFDSILVLSEEPFIPWEILFLVEPGKGISKEGRFLAELGLVRWLYDVGQPPTRLTIRKGRARSIIPQYPDIPSIDLKPLPEAQAEADFLIEKYAAVPVEADPGPVRTLLQGPGSFDLLHFAGHGAAAQGVVGEASVMLRGETTSGVYVPEYLEAVTVEYNADLGDGRPVVVLNACQAGRADWSLTGLGGFAQAFLKRGAGLFVGTLWSVGDAPARVFTESFYDALNAGLTVGEAAREARAKAKGNMADPTWLAYAVYGHPGASLTREGF